MPSSSKGQSPDAPGNRGSSFRVVAGMLLFVGALIVALLGFSRLVTVLDHGGYGTPAMRNALVILGAAGACLAGGIATLIWDVAKRYER